MRNSFFKTLENDLLIPNNPQEDLDVLEEIKDDFLDKDIQEIQLAEASLENALNTARIFSKNMDLDKKLLDENRCITKEIITYSIESANHILNTNGIESLDLESCGLESDTDSNSLLKAAWLRKKEFFIKLWEKIKEIFIYIYEKIIAFYRKIEIASYKIRNHFKTLKKYMVLFKEFDLFQWDKLSEDSKYFIKDFFAVFSMVVKNNDMILSDDKNLNIVKDYFSKKCFLDTRDILTTKQIPKVDVAVFNNLTDDMIKNNFIVDGSYDKNSSFYKVGLYGKTLSAVAMLKKSNDKYYTKYSDEINKIELTVKEDYIKSYNLDMGLNENILKLFNHVSEFTEVYTDYRKESTASYEAFKEKVKEMSKKLADTSLTDELRNEMLDTMYLFNLTGNTIYINNKLVYKEVNVVREIFTRIVKEIGRENLETYSAKEENNE